MAQPLEKSCAPNTVGGIRVLRLPVWVLEKIGLRPYNYTGQLTINFFQGGVTNVEWRQIEKELKQ